MTRSLHIRRDLQVSDGDLVMLSAYHPSLAQSAFHGISRRLPRAGPKKLPRFAENLN